MGDPVSKGVTVSGVGEVGVPPDLMTVDIGVSVRADTVAEAANTARERANALIESLAGSGIDRKDITTVNYSVFPEYDHHEGRQRLLGFRVSNDLRVSVHDLSGVGEIIDNAVAAAGDVVTVNNIGFSVDDDVAARARAREKAWADALAKAEHLAGLAGRTLGRAVSIIESSGRTPGPRPMMRMAAMADSSPVESGTSLISVTIEVRFELV